MRAFWKEKQVERRAKRAGKRQRRTEYEAEYTWAEYIRDMYGPVACTT
jgi:hypothetical protein